MTLNAHKVLEQYFHTIINQTEPKEATMFTKLKQYWQDKFTFVSEPPARSKTFEELHTLLTEPAPPVVAASEEEDGFWSFEMYTPEWYDETGELNEALHTVHREPHEGTWMEVLDTILDAMEAHYGYSIKEQVYYSVTFPLNDPEFPGFSRCLNDERLQQILLAFPELYESVRWNQTSEKAMFQ